MKKILYIENVASVKAVNFYLSAALAAQKCGFEFHLSYNAADADEDSIKQLYEKYHVIFHQVDFIRKPYDLRNIKAYKSICEIIKKEHIDVIHCNTPIGGVIGRLAAQKCNIQSVIYQAHGFHFYTGAPLINWLLYYPVEVYLARKTDILLTINNEDFERAKAFKLRKNGRVCYVPGVGINTDDYRQLDFDVEKKRTELGLTDTDVALISLGELNSNKNVAVVIRSLEAAPHNAHYYICGVGECEDELKKCVSELSLENNVHFLGYRADIKELLSACDIFVTSSFREGLSRAVTEAMACGLPCIVSNIRGNTDLIDEQGGILCSPYEPSQYTEAIRTLAKDKEKRIGMGAYNKRRVEDFSLDKVTAQLEAIYSELL